MVDTRWFTDRIADKRLSQRRLAHLMGIDPGAMSLMLRGKRRMTIGEAGEIARLLGVEVEEVLMRAGADVRVPGSRVSADVRVPGQGVAVSGPSVSDHAAAGSRPTYQDSITLPVPLGDGSTATLILPRVITVTDADRIAALVKALAL